MKMRNKGKVYPSPSSSSSTLSPPTVDSLSILTLLPAAILALASILSLQDREVLAYMITRSIQSTNPNPSKTTKKSNAHKPPLFDCDCFDCYTSYWFKWDSSPNRELIHQAIEAFEDHLNNGEQSKKKNKKKEKIGRVRVRVEEKAPTLSLPEVSLLENDAAADGEVGLFKEAAPPAEAAVEAVVVRATTAIHHRGLARKVLPDVLGLFNSRLWSLWSPNV